MSWSNVRLSQAQGAAILKRITDAGQGICTVGMVTLMPVPVRGPWWRFWRPWEIRMLEELRTLPVATTVSDGNSLQFEAEGFAGWTWREGERFVEFRLFDSAGRTLMSGGNLSGLPQPGDIVWPPPRIDLSVQVDP